MPDEIERLKFNMQLGTRYGYDATLEVTRRRDNWKAGGGLTLILDHRSTNERIAYLGWTSILAGQHSGDLDRVVEIARLEPIKPAILYKDILGRLTRRQSNNLVFEGPQTKGTGEALITALVELRPDLRVTIDEIKGIARRYPIGNSGAGQVLALQRDASIAAVRMAGMLGVSHFARWNRPHAVLMDSEVPPTFLEGVPEDQDSDSARGHEDRQIDHDAHTMLGWVVDQTHHASWRMFTGFGQRLYVANANRETAETTLGTDLIYYNATRRSLLLVQYKRMGEDGFYRPDGDDGLARQLRRMKAVDRYTAGQADSKPDFRMVSRPSWLKICQSQAYIPQTTDMIPGMYFSREQFEQLREDPRLKGPRGGVGFGFANVPNYLDNTMFNRLVESGLIGTTGTSTKLLYQQIVRSFGGRKSLVVATLYGEDIPQSKRNTEKRNMGNRI